MSLNWAYNYLPMLGFKLIHVNVKGAPVHQVSDWLPSGIPGTSHCRKPQQIAANHTGNKYVCDVAGRCGHCWQTLKKLHGVHLRAISQKIMKLSILYMTLKIVNLWFQLHLPEANELIRGFNPDRKSSFSLPGPWHPLCPGGRINIKMTSYQYRKSHCGDKTILRLSYLIR